MGKIPGYFTQMMKNLTKVFQLGIVIFLFSGCDRPLDPNTVILNGAVYQTDYESGMFVDISQYDVPLYQLKPMVNGIPLLNYQMSQRYALVQNLLDISYLKQYLLQVDFENFSVEDSVVLPDDFDIYTEGADSVLFALNAQPEIRWSPSDSNAYYYLEVLYNEPSGYFGLVRGASMNQDTSTVLPILDQYGIYRVDVYAYHRGIYHPDRGHLISVAGEGTWEVNGVWTAWIQRTIFLYVL